MNEEEKKLKALKHKTQRTLFSVRGVFPLTLFPDTVRIDENKVDLIYHNFFFSHSLFSILIQNINGVTVTTGLFFATLSVEISGFEQNPEDIRFLPKESALKAKRIILGLVAAHKEGVDLSKIPMEKIVSEVEEIGRARQ